MGFEYDVFLSHNSKDKPVVRGLAERLRDDGLKVWLDEWIIKPGDSIPAKVRRGLEQSRVLLMMLSENFNDSDWAEYEYDAFLFRDPRNKKRRFVPVRLDQSPIRESLQQFAYVDWSKQDNSAYDQLLEACRADNETDEFKDTAPPESDKTPTDNTAKPNRSPAAPAPFSLGHTLTVSSVAISNNGSLAVTGCHDGVVRVWDLEKQKCIAALEGHTDYVRSVAITTDGNTAISGANDNTVKLWDLKKQSCIATLEGHTDDVRSVAITTDGNTAISGADDNTVKLWDLKKQSCIATLEGHTGSVLSVAITTDGNTAISGANDKTVKLWDLKKQSCIATLEGHTGSVNSVAITTDGNTAISGAYDNTVKLWDLKKQSCIATLEGHTSSVRSVAITTDGNTAISGAYDNTVKLWDLKKQSCIATLEGHTGSVLSVAITTDGNTAISGANDNTVKLWDLKKQSCIATLEGHTGSVNSVAITTDGNTAISGAYDNTVKLWDLKKQSCIATLEGHTSPVRSVAITTDGNTAISGSLDNTVKLWDLKKQSCIATLEGHTSSVNSVAITTDGNTAISGANDKTVKLWDLKKQSCIATLEGHTSPVRSVAITTDGNTAISGADDNTVKLWDLKKQSCIATLEGHTSYVLSVAITTDGNTAISGANDNTVKLWDLKKQSCIATLEGHTGPVNSVALTTDGNTAISGAYDNTVKLWDLKKQSCIATLEGHTSSVTSVAITTGGTPLSAGNGVLRLWSYDSHQVTVDAAARYTNAKVLLVGESRVGKTGLAMRIATGEWEATESTDGHWATRLSADYHDDQWATRLKLADEITDEGVQREIWLWDFAGQSDYRLIHQLFMDQTSLVVFVFNPQSDRLFDTLGRWDRDIEVAARNAYAKLLVAARTDVGGLLVTRNSLDEFMQKRNFSVYLETSAKNNIGCKDLVQAIGNNIDWESIPVTGSNETYDRLKTEILKLRDSGQTLVRMNELNQRISVDLPDLDFSLPELTTVVGHLAAPGLVWNLEFGDFVLLHPEKINTYAGAVIRTLRDEANDLGTISEEDIKSGNLKYEGMKRLPDTEESVVLHAMYQTFIKRGLCIQQVTEQGKQLVFPAFFGVDRPEDPVSPPLFATYEFTGFLDDIYASLVVRLHHAPGFEKKVTLERLRGIYNRW